MSDASAARPCSISHAGRGDFVDERDDGEARAPLLACLQANFGQCTVDEFAKAHQATTEDRAGAAVDGNGTALQRVERENRGVQAVSKFVGRVAKTFDFAGGSRFRRHTRVFRDRFRNCGVETAIEGVEFFHGDGRTLLDRERRDCLADVAVIMTGTALLPLAHGSAKVAGEQGYMKIEARFEKLEPASRFGREYLTYVLWAITPEGRAVNLGEIQIDDAESKLEVTTQLQAFGLIVTAEPYFAVTQPSDVVVLENEVRNDTNGKVEVIQAKYELLTRGAYLMNQDASRLMTKPLDPGSPLDLAQARNAVELARLAGADQFAADTFDKAAGLLASAEAARTARRGGNAVMNRCSDFISALLPTFASHWLWLAPGRMVRV